MGYSPQSCKESDTTEATCMHARAYSEMSCLNKESELRIPPFSASLGAWKQGTRASVGLRRWEPSPPAAVGRRGNLQEHPSTAGQVRWESKVNWAARHLQGLFLQSCPRWEWRGGKRR